MILSNRNIMKHSKPIVYLFLDDLRQPEEAAMHTNEHMFIARDWTVVRNYDEFVNYIETNGLPDFISLTTI